MHAEGMIGTGEDDPPHALAPRPLVDLDKAAQVVLDNLGQGPLDARPCHVDEHVDAVEQAVDHRRIAEVSVHDLLIRGERSQRFRSAGGTQADAALQEPRPQHASDLPARP
jgi:hypothetical protein